MFITPLIFSLVRLSAQSCSILVVTLLITPLARGYGVLELVDREGVEQRVADLIDAGDLNEKINGCRKVIVQVDRNAARLEAALTPFQPTTRRTCNSYSAGESKV